MNLKPYPAYKSSGQQWLGEVPAHWEVRPSKSVFGLRNAPEKSGDVHLTPSQSLGVLPQTEYMKLTGSRVVLALAGTRMKHVEVNDFVIHLRSFQGGIEWSGCRGKVSPAYTVLKPSAHVVPSFFRYCLKSRGYIETIASLTDQLRDGQSMRYYDFGKTPLPLPPENEQQDIVTFLDRETSEIDAFIADQEELIALLVERRTATITVAVTQGLTPNAPMSVCDVEWLDRFPDHWTLSKLKHLGSIKYGLGEPPGYVDDGVPLIRATNVSQGKVTSEKLARVNPEDIPQSRILWLRRGDIIVVRSGALTGDSATITSKYEGSIAGFDMVFRAGHAANPDYIQYSLLAPYVKSAQIDQVRIRAAQPHLNSEELGDCSIAMPPKAEQDEIVAYLNRETAEIDAAIADAREAVALSKERRAAVISAAVTGKIDVRGLVAPEVNDVEGVSVGVA